MKVKARNPDELTVNTSEAFRRGPQPITKAFFFTAYDEELQEDVYVPLGELFTSGITKISVKIWEGEIEQES